MTSTSLSAAWGDRRREMYSFGVFDPYRPTRREWMLVQENLAALKAGRINLREFLRKTPHFARWREEHLQKAKALLITNEPGLTGIERVYGDLFWATGPEEVSYCFREAMLSWLSLTNHPRLKEIHGEPGWEEGGSWQSEAPRLARCGKVGYFLAPGEEEEVSGCKILHLTLSPFAQGGGQDTNPRNDQDLEYHQENMRTVRRFCELAKAGEFRRIFIVGSRAVIRRCGGNLYRLDAVRTARKDRSSKVADLLNAATAATCSPQVRICRQWPVGGGSVEVVELIRPAAYELRGI